MCRCRGRTLAKFLFECGLWSSILSGSGVGGRSQRRTIGNCILQGFIGVFEDGMREVPFQRKSVYLYSPVLLSSRHIPNSSTPVPVRYRS